MITPSEPVTSRNDGTAIQNESVTPIEIDPSDVTTKPPRMMVLRFPQRRVSHSTSWLPAIVESDMNAVITPTTQIWSSSRRPSRYGCAE